MPHVFVRLMLKKDAEEFQRLSARIHRHGDILRYGYRVPWGTPYAQMLTNKEGRLTEQRIRPPLSVQEVQPVCDVLNAQLAAQRPVYLFAYHPEANKWKLVVANVEEASVTAGEWQPTTTKEGSTLCDLHFRLNAFTRVADRYLPRVVSNLIYADEAHRNYGNDLSLPDLGPFPIIVDEKIPAKHFDPPDALQVIPARNVSSTPEIHYKRGQLGNKYGKQILSFFQRIIDKVPPVTRIQVYAEMKDKQTDFFSADVASFDVIRGGRGFKSGNRNYTLMFRLYTTCCKKEEQEMLVRHLQDNF